METFLKDRFACYQETKQVVSEFRANQYGGYGSAKVKPSCSAFNACLAAKGYFETYNSQASGANILTIPVTARIDCDW